VDTNAEVPKHHGSLVLEVYGASTPGTPGTPEGSPEAWEGCEGQSGARSWCARHPGTSSQWSDAGELRGVGAAQADPGLEPVDRKHVAKGMIGAMVYFLLFRRAQRIKIGFTSSPFDRVTGLAREMGEIPKVLAIVEGDMADESRILAMFPESRIHPRGEWFRVSTKILDAARLFPNQLNKPTIRTKQRNHHEWQRRFPWIRVFDISDRCQSRARVY
jgi:hypothetical protein